MLTSKFNLLFGLSQCNHLRHYIEESNLAECGIFHCKSYVCSEKFFSDNISLKPWIQQIVDSGRHMKDWSGKLTLSTKCLSELTRGLMSLNCWLYGFWRFLDYLFYESMGANDPRVWCPPILTYGPRGMVGRIYIINHYMHCYILNIEAVGSWFHKIF